MKVHEIADDSGVTIVLEIPNVGRDRVLRIVEEIPETTILRYDRQSQLGFREEDFCEFELDGARFVISEPWNDSSRYYIGEQPPRPSAALDSLRVHLSRVPRFPFWSSLTEKIFRRA